MYIYRGYCDNNGEYHNWNKIESRLNGDRWDSLGKDQ